MQMIKYITLILILFSSSYIGILISKKYSNREKDLKEMKNALNMFLTKIKLTYSPIPEIFEEISTKTKNNIGQIFKIASENMEYVPAGIAWEESLNSSNTNMNKEDIEILRGLSNLLGKVDLEGQVNEVELVYTFLDTQIERAEKEKSKNEKMYKTLGITLGLAMVVILI